MKTTIELDVTDIDNAIREYLKNKHSLIVEKVTFNVNDTSDDRWGGGPRYELTSADVIIAKKD